MEGTNLNLPTFLFPEVIQKLAPHRKPPSLDGSFLPSHLVKKSYFLFAYVINESPVDSFFELTTELVAQKTKNRKNRREPMKKRIPLENFIRPSAINDIFTIGSVVEQDLIRQLKQWLDITLNPNPSTSF